MYRWALYDLRWNPPGYDFLIFLQSALTNGCNAIRFKPGSAGDHGTEEDEVRKLRKIAFRICENYGLKYAVSETPLGEETFPFKSINAHSFKFVRFVKKPFPLIPSPQVRDRVNDALKGRRPIVVFLRESTIQPLRNSSPDWRRWAADRGAVLFEDAQKTDMTPEEIAAYSDQASLTIGIWCGQMVISFLSEHRPYLVFKCANDHYTAGSMKWWNRLGWFEGDQMPWAGKHQKMLWTGRDDYDHIEQEYQAHLNASC